MNAFWHRLKYTVQEDLNSLMEKRMGKKTRLNN